jgi:hypothetical protein
MEGTAHSILKILMPKVARQEGWDVLKTGKNDIIMTVARPKKH